MVRKKTFIIIFLAGFVILLSSFGGSYFWITRLYLPEQINTNENARLLKEWETKDDFKIPSNGEISPEQLEKFIQVNEGLSYILQEFKHQFEENTWRIAFDIIKVQPEWASNKYTILKKYNLSPIQYNWIAEQVLDFWICRWKEESIEKLKKYGWELENFSLDNNKRPKSYELLIKHEKELNKILDIFWLEESNKESKFKDTLNVK